METLCCVPEGLKEGGTFEMPCDGQERFPRWQVHGSSKKDHQKYVLTCRNKWGFPERVHQHKIFTGLHIWLPGPLPDCSLGSLSWLHTTPYPEPCLKGLSSCISFSGWLRDPGGLGLEVPLGSWPLENDLWTLAKIPSLPTRYESSRFQTLKQWMPWW